MINVKIDSRKVEKGDTFVAIRGHVVDGHSFVNKAIENGATRVVVEEDVKCSVPQIIVKDTNKWLIDYVSKNYAKEVNELELLGVTGTNGKTTTAYLIYQMLNELGKKTAYIGTIGFFVPGEEMVKIPNTTPVILDLYELLLTAKSKGCESVVMELSSHALHQKRVKGLEFQAGAFTNLTHDHLDYHKNMKNYLAAKMLLLKQLKGKMIINSDDDYAHYWLEKYNNCVTLGKNGKDYIINSYTNTENGTLIDVDIYNKNYKIETNLKCAFNVYNYLTAFAVAHSIGNSVEDIIKVTKAVYPPKGRCDQIKVGNGEVIIDYAHTPDAVEKIMDAFIEHKTGNIISVVACTGERDTKKRPIMGNIATTKSDYVVFTSDNPGIEDPQKIIDEILVGVKTNNYTVVVDRKEAVEKALDMMKDGDTVLLLGKGHEDYQIIGHEKVHYSDEEEVKKYIKKHNL